MKILYQYHSPNTNGLKVEGGKITIYAYKPTIIHPGEIIKVPTNTSIKTEEGYFIHLTPHPGLISKVCQLFPAVIVLDEHYSEAPLEIPVINQGRNPVNIMPGNELACGRAISFECIDILPYENKVETKQNNNKSTPQKKNVGVKFELK